MFKVSALLLALVGAAAARLNTAVERDLSNTLVFDNDEFQVEVTGNSNVPKYVFFSKDEPDDKHKVMFQAMYEVDGDGNKFGTSNIALPSLKWTISDEEVADDGSLVFWINATQPAKSCKNSNEDRFSTFALRNELFNGTVKFDVILDDYDWCENATEALHLVWKMNQDKKDDAAEGEEPVDEAEDKLCFSDNICFNITTTANVTNSDGESTEIPVKLESGNGAPITIVYERFNGSLYHDPQFGYFEKEEEETKCTKGFFRCLLQRFREMLGRFLPWK